MSVKLSSTLARARQPHWLWGAAFLLAFLAGRAPPKDDAAKSSTAPKAEKSPPAKSTPTVASQRQSKQATPQAEKPAKSEPAPADKPGAAKPSGTSSEVALRDVPAENGQPMTDQEREALAEMIRAAVIAGQKENAKEPAKPATEQKPAGQSQAKAETAKPAALVRRRFRPRVT